MDLFGTSTFFPRPAHGPQMPPPAARRRRGALLQRSRRHIFGLTREKSCQNKFRSKKNSHIFLIDKIFGRPKILVDQKFWSKQIRSKCIFRPNLFRPIFFNRKFFRPTFFRPILFRPNNFRPNFFSLRKIIWVNKNSKSN